MTTYTEIVTRPDPRKATSWCREGAAHDHGACGPLWDSTSQADIDKAVCWAEDLGERERSEINVANTVIRLIERAPGSWAFGVTFPGRDEFLMHPTATADQLAESIASARSKQIRTERAATAQPAVVGDVLGANEPIPANVTKVETSDGLWRRAVGDERYFAEDDGTVDREVEYDWVTDYGGGWASTDGLYDFLPIVVREIATEPAA